MIVSTKQKLMGLLAVIVVAFGALSYQSYVNVTKMKQSIDLIYFGSYVQVEKLGAVREGYLLKDAKLIKSSWEYYKNSYKSDDELRMVDAVDDMIRSSLKRLHKLSSHEIASLRQAVDRVISYEKGQAYTQKVAINESYQETKNSFILILTLLIVFIVLLSYFIFRSITTNEQKLKELNHILKEMSLTDELTKLYNRRFFNSMIDQEFKRAVRHQHPIYFMMMDVDHFKKYNDTYGHQKGDEVLQAVSKAIKSTLKRSEDYAFRLGGEEFGVVLSSIELKDAVILAKQIVARVESLGIEHRNSSTSDVVTISVGLNHMTPTKSSQMAKFIEEADELLYHSKESGRNRVTLP
jgi:diguanylate cyclase (GGDEF)-like protein